MRLFYLSSTGGGGDGGGSRSREGNGVRGQRWGGRAEEVKEVAQDGWMTVAPWEEV